MLLALGLAVGACAAPTQTLGPEPPLAAAAPLEDAEPRYYDEDEVDVPPRPVAAIEPRYPPALRAMGLEGDVEVRLVVLADGSVGGVRLVASSGDAFTAAAREALKEARFHPAERARRPVASWVTLRLRFRLEE